MADNADPADQHGRPDEARQEDVGVLRPSEDSATTIIAIFNWYRQSMRHNIRRVLQAAQAEHEDQEHEGHWFPKRVVPYMAPRARGRANRDFRNGDDPETIFDIVDFPYIIEGNSTLFPGPLHDGACARLFEQIRVDRNKYDGHKKYKPGTEPSPIDAERIGNACVTILTLCQYDGTEKTAAVIRRYFQPDAWSQPDDAELKAAEEELTGSAVQEETRSRVESAEREDDPAPLADEFEADPARPQQRPDESPRLEVAATAEQLGHEQRALADVGEARRIASSTQGGSSDGGGGPGTATLAGAGDEDRSSPANEGGALQGQRVRRWLRQHPLLAAFAALAIAALTVVAVLGAIGEFSSANEPSSPPVEEPPPPPSKPRQEEQEEQATTQKGQEQAKTQEEQEEEQGTSGTNGGQGQGTGSNGGTTIPPPTLSRVSAGGSHSCRLTTEGRAECWGRDGHGEIDPLDPDDRFVSISAGGAHTCGLRADGTAVCWGWDGYGQLAVPLVRFSSLSAGFRHNCGITADNTIRCWGSHRPEEHGVPEPFGQFTQVSAGYYHTCALNRERDAVCWGLPYADETHTQAGPFVAVSAGEMHACGRRLDGVVECWGDDREGETNAPPATRFTAVSVGQIHSCGIVSDGAVRCWGSDEHGRATPPEGKFDFINAGARHTCATRDDGEVKCWGDNGCGQIDGNATGNCGQMTLPPVEEPCLSLEGPDGDCPSSSTGRDSGGMEDEDGRTQPANGPDAASTDPDDVGMEEGDDGQ